MQLNSLSLYLIKVKKKKKRKIILKMLFSRFLAILTSPTPSMASLAERCGASFVIFE